MRKLLNFGKFALSVFVLFLMFPLPMSARSLAGPRACSSSATDETVATKRWDAQALKEVSAAKTLSEILIALNFTRKGSAARELGNRKWGTLYSDALLAAKNSGETRAVLDRTRSEDERWNTVVVAREYLGNSTSSDILHDLYGEPALQKQWDARALQDVVDAETLQEIRRAFAGARDDSPARKLAIIKASKFLPDN